MSQNPVPTPVNPVTPPIGAGPIYFNSAQRIIQFAMWDAKILGRGQEPSSEDFAEYMPRLNELVNYYQTQGLKLWLQQDIAITPIAGQNLYSIGPSGNVVQPRPPRILEAYYQDSNFNRRPLIPLSRQEWDYLSTLVQQGAINSYFVDKQQFVTNFWLWLTPDATAATGTVHALEQIQVNNSISLTDQMNFPQEWFILLHWGLAEQISQGQPLAIQQVCQSMAQRYQDALEAWDVEDASTMFQPDQRSGFGSNRFR